MFMNCVEYTDVLKYSTFNCWRIEKMFVYNSHLLSSVGVDLMPGKMFN